MQTRYKSILFAGNDHKELQRKVNAWLRDYRPGRILGTNFVSNGAEYTYCLFLLYAPGDD